ncbi:tRNA (N6-threonylcarbamoyladenosine(37)-N6)-methyltransferase TrmO [Paracoccus sp. DMF-8]|uniref:tRNA (N6-threonylcarbamoyladenosine(37)-N6)-methyltransferase TrmO n=1 Tax=Paracoccus sp. DMF-8 TaxID=3019445 RepID=UPI0023E37D1A|nr:tRNA (N6-threonylcarbamoyladenosine(37)-N6)-methyltransferase TrmO [Paracoccus sp. DMF-8]MDF3607693.1 tRNA (N6-threonylcarbamoyladenosine(37)-N6)-methyltransferase TrmO [Paracoccus sp. DMF-8]
MSASLRPHERAVTAPDRQDAALWFIGQIHTPWADRSDCPRKGDPVNGPLCRIALDPLWSEALLGVEDKDHLQILYWLHQSRRDVVQQNPNFGDRAIGTFALRSPLRPNPIASSTVRLERIAGTDLFVRGLDCVTGTPLVDIKPVFCCDESSERRHG